MSTSDSDYSIDWLASDEDDYDSPDRLSPQRAEESPAPPTSTSSSGESPTSCFLSPRSRRRSGGCKDAGRRGVDADSPASPQAPTVGPVQGFTVCEQHSSRKRAHGAGSDKCSEMTQPDTENEMFMQKCVELRCYVRPLSSILQGLRSGRYSERLSSFQESVATDRIQRIMGVLQNPNKGGRFLSIVLKIEEMLQSWFPHVRREPTQTDDCAPAKKQKQQQQQQQQQQHHHHRSASPPLPASLASLCSTCCSTRLISLHTSPKTPESTPVRSTASASPLPARVSQEVTQDNAVSSSSDSHSGPPCRHSRRALSFQISSPCLERLLQAKESIIAPRTVGDGGCLS